MKNLLYELDEKILSNDYCIGCGACSYFTKGAIKMKKNYNGQIQATIEDYNGETDINLLEICPFYNSTENEDTLGKKLFGSLNNVNHDEYLGYYLANYAGYVISDNFRANGSSGGFGSWIPSKMIQSGLVDKVIHVKSSNNKDTLFEYVVSSNLDELKQGSKSKYYPIEMSEVLQFVNNNDNTFLFVGLPCFIKALRLLQKKDKILRERIKFTMGLVCGHLKSDFFAKSIAWELGIKPNELTSIDFRVKIPSRAANQYGVEISGYTNGKLKKAKSLSKNLFVTNWGHGHFKYNACEYCDDVLSETADVTIGDAWLPEYNQDSGGTNIVIVRNPIINRLFEDYNDEVKVDILSSKSITSSQSGGFRHRREGLKYRLYLKDISNKWRPLKRVKASDDISEKRKNIYLKRMDLVQESFKNYHKATEKNNFRIYKIKMNKIIRNYEKIYNGNLIVHFIKRVFRKINQIIKNIFN